MYWPVLMVTMVTRYFLEEADFHLRDLLCLACGRQFEEVQDLLHHYFRQVKQKGKKRLRHQDQLARIAKPFMGEWETLVHQTGLLSLLSVCGTANCLSQAQPEWVTSLGNINGYVH